MGKERAAAVIHFLRERVSMLTLIYLRTCPTKSKLHHWQIFCRKRYTYWPFWKVLVDTEGRNGRGARSSMHSKWFNRSLSETVCSSDFHIDLSKNLSTNAMRKLQHCKFFTSLESFGWQVKKLLRTKIITLCLNSLIYDVLIFSTRMKNEFQPTRVPTKKIWKTRRCASCKKKVN